MRIILIAAAAALSVLAGCQPRSPQPVEIDPSDMCARCRMAISQKQFAAQMLDAGERVHKFDDIGCLLRFLKEETAQPAAIFVVDYRARRWIAAGDAAFVRTEKLATPMGGGIAAFASRADAAEFAARHAAAVVGFEQLRAQ